MMTFVENISSVAQAAAGYRQECERAGFSPTVAEQMALQLHGGMISMLLKGVGGATS